MSTEVDSFSVRLLDEAKRFLEKGRAAEGDAQAAYLHAALMVGFSALESHLNGIAEELSIRPNANVLHTALLLEKDIKIVKGKWELGPERFYRLEDRIAFLLVEYGKTSPSDYGWWSSLTDGMKLRNRFVHPREALKISPENVEHALSAIINALNAVYLSVFRKGHPSYNRRLQSTMTF